MSGPSRKTVIAPPRRTGRPGSSLLGPILLLAVGFFFLGRNLGLVDDLNWRAVLQLWPFILLFAGFNIILSRLPRPVGTVLSGLLSLVAIGLLGAMLLAGDISTWAIGRVPTPVVRQESLQFDAPAAAEARIDLSLGSEASFVTAGRLDGPLFRGDIRFLERPHYQAVITGEGARVVLQAGRRDITLFQPGRWLDPEATGPWLMALHPGTPLRLNVTGGAGLLDLDLSGLNLVDLTLHGGPGPGVLRLPAGTYTGAIEGGAGRLTIFLPATGAVELDVTGGAGRIDLLAPPELPLRVALLAGGPGALELEDGRLTGASGRPDERGVWTTREFDPQFAGLRLNIRLGAGNVRVRPSLGD